MTETMAASAMRSGAQPPTSIEITRALAAAAALLADSQDEDGGFSLAPIASLPQGDFGDSLFSTAMVLGVAGAALTRDSRMRAASFILERRDETGFWRWSPDRALPPDSDDTACCLGAIHRAGVQLDAGREARLLRKFWRWGGPFRTWLARGSWNQRARDDAVVNCNILWALEELGVPVRPKERRAVARMVGRQRGPTRYYCSEASLAWAATRVGIPTPHLRPPIEASAVENPLDCALWSLALAGTAPDLVRRLLEMQQPDGGWHAGPWVTAYVGAWESRAVSVAFAIAALSGYTPLV